MSINYEYQAPTALTAVYNHITNEVDLAWVAPIANNLAVFNVPGTYAYVPAQGFQSFDVTVIDGGGGGSNAQQISGEAAIGGGSGGAGGISLVTYTLGEMAPSTVVTVGAGGAGGAQVVAAPNTTTQFNAGSDGQASSFGALAGQGGKGATSQVGGVGGVGVTQTGGAGGTGAHNADGSVTAATAGSAATEAPGGGGGGSTPAQFFAGAQAAAAGGAGQSAGASPSAGGAAGAIGTSGTAGVAGASAPGNVIGGFAGGGGGGGGAIGPDSSVTGLAGGNGGNYGAGGGGGGGGYWLTGPGNTTMGAGGAGAGGVVAVYAYNTILPLTGYAVLRDGIQIGTAGLTTAFSDPSPLQGEHCYTVEALSGTTIISPVSNQACVLLCITLQGQAAGNAGSDVLLTWDTCNCADTQFEIFEVGVSEPIATLPQNSVDGFVVMQLNADTTYSFYIVGDVSGSSNSVTVTTGCRAVEIFNCDCSLEPTQQTLAELRFRVMVRLGYPNQAANPPPGMSMLVDAFLYDAQKLIWKQLSRAGLNVERFFRWVMVPGQRYYGISANADKCDLKLDPYKIVWAGFEDLNHAWYRLTEGVPPEYYTRANINFGWPTHYEIRSCIEIFPAPQAPYTLWIKGDMGLASFTNDSDTATIDDQAVFMLALGMAKSHYGQADGTAVLAQADTYIRGLVAGLHGTRRYVPRTKAQNPATPPRFLPLGDAQA